MNPYEIEMTIVPIEPQPTRVLKPKWVGRIVDWKNGQRNMKNVDADYILQEGEAFIEQGPDIVSVDDWSPTRAKK